jgi:protein-S-isoprenylcysteine O-methyltransferase Ste14
VAILALVVLVAWVALVTLLRGYLYYRRTGLVPNLGRDEPGSPQRWSRLLSVLGVALAVAAPFAELLGLDPIPFLDRPAVRWTGFGLAVAGIGGTLAAQSAMGDSWRGDVDPDVRTPLVTTGPFNLVRNPILTCTLVTALGLALMVPNVFAVLMLAAFVVALQIQVRLVEEPYLERVHGDAYRRYAARTGRFLPGIGRLPYITRDPSG